MSFLASNSIFLVVPVRALSVSIPTIDGFVGWIKIIPLDCEPAETPGALPQKWACSLGFFIVSNELGGLDKVVPRGKMLAVDQIMRFSKQRGIIL
jgi:hypothetical protein